MAKENIPVIDLTREGLREAADLAKVQTDTRADVIRTVHALVDTLQLACDLVGTQISKTIDEYHQGRPGHRSGFLSRTGTQLKKENLGILLHEGKVCGALHVLGDRFANPLSKEVWSCISAWEAVTTFFRRSNSMTRVLYGLREGERVYLDDIARFLDDVRNFAEQHCHDQGDLAEAACEELVRVLRSKRTTLSDSIRALRDTAEECVQTLH